MSSLLKWRPAERNDRESLQGFTCTRPPEMRRVSRGFRKVPERPWERLVQGKIRSSQPPYGYPLHMLVGEDNEGIAAVTCLEELDGPAQIDLRLMALAMRLRFRGGGYADEMADETIRAIETRASQHGISVVSLSAMVDERNMASQKFCRRMKLHHTGMASETLQQWSASLTIASPPTD